jgi:hypothetical protein
MPIALGSGGIGIAPNSNAAIDLCTAAYASDALSAGGITLSTAQLTILPTLITAASREIIRYCGRQFALATYDEIVTPEGGRQDRGEPASVKLSYFPVQSVTRVQTGRSTVLTVNNTDQTTNQLASVAFAVSGDVEYNDLTYTGLNLSRTASGTVAASSLSFTTYPTVNALAAAINALGGGWKAAVASNSTPSPGLIASTELVGVREPKNAFSPGASLDAFTTAADSYDIDRRTGIMRCYGWSGWGAGGFGGAFGDPFGSSWDGSYGLGGGVLGFSQYRVVYSAGYATIPEDIQQVCAELVKLTYERLKTDMTLQSETTGKYTFTARQAIQGLPEWAIQILTFRKDNFV